MITQDQLQQIEKWLFTHARSLEIAKWNLIFHKGTKECLVNELLKYQNPNGGFGNSLEPDITTPDSSTIASVEAIMLSQDYGLDLGATWAKKLLSWYENTMKDTPDIWERVPKSINDHPHAPWWGYDPNAGFKPFPNAIVASALLQGTNSQRILGEQTAERCMKFLLDDTSYDWFDTYSLQLLFTVLMKLDSPLIIRDIVTRMKLRVVRSICVNPDEWPGFVAQPLHSIDSPNSYWHTLSPKEVQMNLDYWESTLTADGYWPLNFDWGVDSIAAQTAANSWLGITAVKHIKTLKAFHRVEIESM